MDPKIFIILLLIVTANASPFREDQPLIRTKRSCRYLFGNCAVDPCCEHLFCNSFSICGWDAKYTLG
uniref:LolToxF n=1 Tax=Bichromomyia olmeca TaxID=715919 RepID=A0A1B1V3G8_9DIPT|nr:LolToxF [Bichromomyia olmeca]